ncbi:hypothetical protein BC939DRAFT_452219 [Gamsiella multidivaricata]|uniref:uncharacterized protein n=1 Tax=Gamsiella multidivaricata TaxID=101098 RepID=UPI00221EA786|nr:uncharacterized protein BC939DRAFT_452219 [Gamsiella multidivaricata]KAI7823237.1 hypothetical protein BC939DRAFT_452219 [Gamsiella multidivaricata]
MSLLRVTSIEIKFRSLLCGRHSPLLSDQLLCPRRTMPAQHTCGQAYLETSKIKNKPP